jgi:hypothetical protein
MEQIANPGLWSEVGGLNGLVILALFVVLYAYSRALSTILDKHRGDLAKLMYLHAKEREEWGRIVDERQRETNTAIKAMADALTKMAVRRRYTDELSGD